VDGAPEMRDILRRLLDTEDVEIVAVPLGRVALEVAGRTRFDVVLTDLRLPDIPGELVIRQLRATAGPVPRVVAMTEVGEAYQSRARGAGAEVVLVKPFDWTALRGCLSPPQAAPKADAA